MSDRKLLTVGLLIVIFNTLVGGTGLILVEHYKGKESPQNDSKPKVDYLWVYKNTNTQKASSDFKRACERELENVSDNGLSSTEKERNDLTVGEVVDSFIDYNFDFKDKGDYVEVNASCNIEGEYRENALRILDYETTKIKSKYILTK